MNNPRFLEALGFQFPRLFEFYQRQHPFTELFAFWVILDLFQSIERINRLLASRENAAVGQSLFRAVSRQLKGGSGDRLLCI